MIQHDGGRHIDFRQMSISPRQTTANNCKMAFSLHVVESASDEYSFYYDDQGKKDSTCITKMSFHLFFTPANRFDSKVAIN